MFDQTETIFGKITKIIMYLAVIALIIVVVLKA